MKRLGYLFPALVVILLVISETPAQFQRHDPVDRSGASASELESERQAILKKQAEEMKRLSSPPLAKRNAGLQEEVKKQNRIALNFKELKEASQELIVIANRAHESDFKKAGKIANLIAKSSYQLRQELSDGKELRKSEALMLPPGNRTAQLRHLAQSIYNLVEQIGGVDMVIAVDLANLEQTPRNLEKIESLAFSVRTLSRQNR
jgi:hypothetical protein